MATAQWRANGLNIDYYDIYPIIATLTTLQIKLANNTIIVDYTNGDITINGEVAHPTSTTDTYEPLYLQRYRGESYNKEKKKNKPHFLGFLLGWEATRVDSVKHIKAVWLNPDGTYEWRDYK